MRRGGRADEDGVHVGAFHDFFEGRHLGACCGGKLLRRRGMRVGHRHEAGIGVVGGVAPVNTANAACAQNGDPDHVSPDMLCRLPENLELKFQHQMLIE
jgi:hypothetical protein